MRTAAESREAFHADLSDPRHGTTNGYGNLRCRCDRCRRANADHQREYMRKRYPQRVQQRQPSAQHGTRSMYNKGCRCEPCRESQAEYARRAKANRKPCSLPGCPRLARPHASTCWGCHLRKFRYGSYDADAAARTAARRATERSRLDTSWRLAQAAYRRQQLEEARQQAQGNDELLELIQSQQQEIPRLFAYSLDAICADGSGDDNYERGGFGLGDQFEDPTWDAVLSILEWEEVERRRQVREWNAEHRTFRRPVDTTDLGRSPDFVGAADGMKRIRHHKRPLAGSRPSRKSKATR